MIKIVDKLNIYSSISKEIITYLAIILNFNFCLFVKEDTSTLWSQQIFQEYEKLDGKWVKENFLNNSNVEYFYITKTVKNEISCLREARIGSTVFVNQFPKAIKLCKNFNKKKRERYYGPLYDKNIQLIGCSLTTSRKESENQDFDSCKCVFRYKSIGGRDQAKRDYAYIYGQCTREEVCKIFGLDCDPLK